MADEGTRGAKGHCKEGRDSIVSGIDGLGVARGVVARLRERLRGRLCVLSIGSNECDSDGSNKGGTRGTNKSIGNMHDDDMAQRD